MESIGGLDAHIKSLKESVFLPLTYPEIFSKLGIKAPGGVLFHGPPGTGKTMMARALANSCSQGSQKISFFMRKGADCLSKYHGEAERQLRLLFAEAARLQPSIIFFDEIDGLAPVRSSRQDQIHSSIVSTLLALMDGLDKRGMVVLIGATNRPDAVDPALRRPGRFDREFYFPLPDAAARAKILEIYTKDWKPPLSKKCIEQAANACVGFGGADLKALCTEAGIRALRRTFPQVRGGGTASKMR
uniref:AAA+ ATPase domain-containing protein n=1 Tax=Guillardia theta (strain CCMP2712) TaxID=905079 RepID=A0A0C3TVB8_GUITC